VSIRMWTRDATNGTWWPGKKGISIRVRELPYLADAIAAALELARSDQPPQSVRGRRSSPRPRGLDPANLPPAGGREEYSES